jgi:hypothetical protein
VRWDELFADLDGQASAAQARELTAMVEERSRAQLSLVALLERLRAAGGRPIDVDLVDGDRLQGRLAEVGAGWLSMQSGPDDCVIVVDAVAAVRVRSAPARGSQSAAPVRSLQRPLADRLGLRPVLRALARQRRPVRLATVGGGRLSGTVDAVGADHVELAEHPVDVPRRPSEVRGVALVPFGSLLWIRAEADSPDRWG